LPKKRTKIYVPSQWDTVIAMVRKTNPYLVVPVKYTDFYNLKEFCVCYCKNMKKGTNGEKVNWLKVKWIRVTKSNLKSIFIEILASDKSTRGRPQTIANAKLNALYGTKLCISAEK